MANTNFDQATLDQIEAVISYALTIPKEAVKGRIDFDQGGSIEYRDFDELITARNNIKKIIDSETEIDLDVVKKNAL
jgi:hypothetical protein